MPVTRAIRKLNRINTGVTYTENDLTLGDLFTMEFYTIGKQKGDSIRKAWEAKQAKQ